MAASAALNGTKTSSRISAATRERILKAAKRLRYRPNAAARALLQRRMHTFGLAAVLYDALEVNHYFLALFNGVLSAATHHDQTTTVFALHNWEEDARERLPGFCDGRIDGLILLAPTCDEETIGLLPSHFPIVTIHGNLDYPGAVNIECDDEHGGFAITEHLIAQGHRRILHLAGLKGVRGTECRVKGYRRALKQHKIRFSRSLLHYSDFNQEIARQATLTWFRQNQGQPLPDAIFCGNDGMAVGCMHAISEMGLRIPDDISVVGFDDTSLSRSSVPQLTTVKQPLVQMGRMAVDLLMRRIDSNQDEVQQVSPIVLPVEVVPRGTVGPRPKKRRLVPSVS